MNIIAAILIFGLIVLVHELGHFLSARKFGVEVTEFSIGMGPKIHSWYGKNTVYSLRILPIGGYCSMVGEDAAEETEEKKDEDGSESAQKPVNAYTREGNFSFKPVWQRFLVIFAGPAFNFILAFLMALIIIGNLGVDKCVLSDVMPGYPAAEAGLRAGDIITGINNQKITVYRDLQLYLEMNPGESLRVSVKRPDSKSKSGYEKISFEMMPKYNDEYQAYMLGIVTDGNRSRTKNVWETLYYSAYEIQFNITTTIKEISMMIAGKFSVDNLSGPVKIVSIIGETVQEAKPYGFLAVFYNLINMVLLLSAALGIMNLLPLPALDGGRLVFLILEGILGHPVNRRFETYVHLAGFVLLMLLMVFVMYNDIRSLIR